VIQKLHNRTADIFTREEKDQLKEAFELSKEELEILLEVSCYIFEEVNECGTIPSVSIPINIT
jgi:hypothetical protein